MVDSWTNLTFHGLGELRGGLDPGEQAVWLSRDAFLRHLDSASQHDRVLITFDDGNRSDFDIGLPALVERKMRAIFFVIVGRIGKQGYLDREHLAALLDAGMEVGSHGMNHRPWRRMDSKTMRSEIHDAKQALETLLGRAVRKVACPFGTYDRRSLAALRAAGVQTVFTSDGGPARAGGWVQARTSLRRGDPDDVVHRLVAARERRPSLVRRAKLAVKRWR
jgi:peptidoglycan/xylan/chitin deacetylase (PgdA/CDA1 family)